MKHYITNHLPDEPSDYPSGDSKTCPFCGESILAIARKCKHCGEAIDVALRAALEARRMAERASRQRQPLVFMNAAAASSSASATGTGKRRSPCLGCGCALLLGMLGLPVLLLVTGYNLGWYSLEPAPPQMEKKTDVPHHR